MQLKADVNTSYWFYAILLIFFTETMRREQSSIILTKKVVHQPNYGYFWIDFALSITRKSHI